MERDHDLRSGTGTRGRGALLGVALLAAAVAPYATLLELPFLSDDYHAVAYASRGAEVALEDLEGPQFGAATVRFWRPLVTASLVLDHALFGLDPLPYRATNLLFHAAAVLLVYALARSLGLARSPSFLAALLFAAFPYGPGTVGWVVGRVDGLAAPFFLGALVLHERSKGRVSWGSLACAVLALGAKEVSAALPLAIFALEVARRGGVGRSWLRASPYLGVLLAYGLARRLALGVWVGGYPPNPAGSPALETAIGLGGTIARVLYPGAFEGAAGHVVGWASLGALALGARRAGGPARTACFGLALWALAAIPAFEVLRRPDDLPNLRVLYIPAAGIAIATVAVFATCRSRMLRLAPALLLVTMGLGLSRSLADHRRAGRQVEEALDAVRRGEEVCPDAAPLFVEGVPRVLGSAYVFNWGFGAATSPPFRTRGPVVRLLRECLPQPPVDLSAPPGPPAGRCLVRILPGGSLEILPRREKVFWKVRSPAFDGTIDRTALQAAFDAEDFPLEFDPPHDAPASVTAFTSLGHNTILLPAPPRGFLRDVLSRPFSPESGLTLTHTLVQAFDAGDREFLLHFRSGDLESDLLRFRVAEDVAEAFRAFYLQR